MNRSASRRTILKGIAALTTANVLGPSGLAAAASGRIVVIGAGFGGAIFARTLHAIAPRLSITLIDARSRIVTCPFSNSVVAGLNEAGFITHTLDAIGRTGIEVVADRAVEIDPAARSVRLAGRAAISYDRLVLSPGVDIKWGTIENYDVAAAAVMPHAWKAGPQTLLLRRQLMAMRDGGTVVMTIPANPYRCPAGPYERASLIAHYLKTAKPKSKLILLDAKDDFAKRPLFTEAWSALYGKLIEWVPSSQGGGGLRVDTSTMTIHSASGTHKADVANIIPPQSAARLVLSAGLADGGDWCAVDPVSFESKLIAGVHVLGDAIIAGQMPKTGFAAGSQARACAHAIAALQSGRRPSAAPLIDTSYSLVAPDYGISDAQVYRVADDKVLTAVEGAGGASPLGADAQTRKLEADYARGWYRSITEEMYG